MIYTGKLCTFIDNKMFLRTTQTAKRHVAYDAYLLTSYGAHCVLEHKKLSSEVAGRIYTKRTTS